MSDQSSDKNEACTCNPRGACGSCNWHQSSDKNEACTCNCGTLDGAKAYSNEDVSGLPPDLVVAMTVWGEARGESLEGKKAVASVICNRAMRKSHAGHLPFEVELSAVCLAPHQFSCWSDGEFVQQEPDYDSAAWLECHEVAKALFESTFRPCTNATHYFSDSINPPYWAAKMKFVEKIGHHSFYLESSWRG